LRDWELLVAYEQENPWLTPEIIGMLPFPTMALSAGQIPGELWKGEVRAVVLSTAQPRQVPIGLVAEAMTRGVPTIAIEESNQIGLNQGTVNNYLLPVDYVLTASNYEAAGMIAAGFPERRFEVTGWPFHAGGMGRVPVEKQRVRKAALGLDPVRPLAALTLTGFNTAGESSVVRQRQLELAAQGLPPDYQLAIKPHPIEKLRTLQPFVDQFAPLAMVVDGMMPIEELLEATDILLNRGVSQICIEALIQEIPVVVLHTDIHTPFHDLAPEVVVRQPQDLNQILIKLGRNRKPMAMYDAFKKVHMPYSPDQARVRTCKRVIEIASNGSKDPCSGRQWFDLGLFEAWRGGDKTAMMMATREEVLDAGCPTDELARLICCRASREDLDMLLQFFKKGVHSDLIRSLWIKQMCRQKMSPQEADHELMEEFPPTVGTFWFVPDMRTWTMLLMRTGQVERADAFRCKIEERFFHVAGVPDLIAEISFCRNRVLGLHRALLRGRVKAMLRPAWHWARRFLG
jgi:hypothetical protein